MHGSVREPDVFLIVQCFVLAGVLCVHTCAHVYRQRLSSLVSSLLDLARYDWLNLIEKNTTNSTYTTMKKNIIGNHDSSKYAAVRVPAPPEGTGSGLARPMRVNVWSANC